MSPWVMPPVTSVVPSMPLSISTHPGRWNSGVSRLSPLISREIPLPQGGHIHRGGGDAHLAVKVLGSAGNQLRHLGVGMGPPFSFSRI